jgi:hypothetical protein
VNLIPRSRSSTPEFRIKKSARKTAKLASVSVYQEGHEL